MALNRDTQAGQAEKCEQHNETLEFLCKECEEVICKMCLPSGQKHSKHDIVKLSDGVELQKKRVGDTSQALKDLAGDARKRQVSDAKTNNAITAETANVIKRINQSINDVIDKLEATRIDMITFAIRTAQQWKSRSSALIDIHLRRSSLQVVSKLLGFADCDSVPQLLKALEFGKTKEMELQLFAKKQRKLSPQLLTAQAQVLAKVQTIDECWMQEIGVTLDSVNRLHQYTVSLAEKQSRSPEQQVFLIHRGVLINFQLTIS